MKLSAINANNLVTSLHAGVVVHAPDTSVLFANPAALKMLRLTEAQMLGKTAPDPDWHFLDSYRQVLPLEAFPVNRVLTTKKAIENLEVGITDSQNKKITWVLCNAYPEFDATQQLTHVVVTFIDITCSKHDIPFQDVVELANDLVLVLDASASAAGEYKIIYANQALTRITGYQKSDVYAKPHQFFDGFDTDESTRAEINNALAEQRAIRAQLLNYKKSGEAFWLDLTITPLCNEQADVVYFAVIAKDITMLKSTEAKLRDLATRDPLTQLLNRRGFISVAREALKLAAQQKSAVICAMVDIDFFKKVNDQYGHDMGDKVLGHFSAVMRSCFRSSDIISRVGGEEFCILLTECDLDAAIRLLEHFRKKLQHTPFCLDNQEIAITTSIGVSSNSRKRQSLTLLMKQADDALYLAKRNGRNRTEISASKPI